MTYGIGVVAIWLSFINLKSLLETATVSHQVGNGAAEKDNNRYDNDKDDDDWFDELDDEGKDDEDEDDEVGEYDGHEGEDENDEGVRGDGVIMSTMMSIRMMMMMTTWMKMRMRMMRLRGEGVVQNVDQQCVQQWEEDVLVTIDDDGDDDDNSDDDDYDNNEHAESALEIKPWVGQRWNFPGRLGSYLW